MSAPQFRFAESVDDATASLMEHGDDARLVCGGTALAILLRQRLIAPAYLIGVGRIRELQAIDVLANGTLRLGAAVRVRDAELDEKVHRWQALGEALAHVATPRIRNMATIGGGIAHADPAQDPMTALTALNATVRVAGQRSRDVPIGEFFLDYYETALEDGEMVAGVDVPPLAARTGSAYVKFLPRSVEDYGTVTAAATVVLDPSGAIIDATLALGAVHATPVAPPVAGALRGHEPSPQVFREVAEMARERVDPIDDVRGSAEYKRDMAVVFGRRALELASQRATAVPV